MILILQRNEWPRGRNSVTQLPLVTQLVRGQTGLLAQAPAPVFAPHCPVTLCSQQFCSECSRNSGKEMCRRNTASVVGEGY